MAKQRVHMSPESERLDMVIDLLRQSLAVELLYHRIPRNSIAKILHLKTATVISMLKDVKKGEE